MAFDILETEKRLNEQLAQQLNPEENQEKETADEVVEQSFDEVQEESQPQQELPLQEEIEEEEVSLHEDEEEEDLEKPNEAKGWAKMRHKLKQEKEERKRLEQQLQELRENQARLEGAQQAYQAQPQQQQVVKDSDPEPDREYDPDAWRDWDHRQTKKQLEMLKAQAAENEQFKLIQQAKTELNTIENQYKVRDADYDKKVQYLMDVESRKLRISNPNLSDAQIAQHLETEKLKFAGDAYSRGVNPAQAFSQLAEAYGYQPSANGKAMNSAMKSTEAPEKNLNLDKIKRNAKKNASLIGGTPAAENTRAVTSDQVFNMSLDQLARMDDKSFNQTVEQAMRKPIG